MKTLHVALLAVLLGSLLGSSTAAVQFLRIGGSEELAPPAPSIHASAGSDSSGGQGPLAPPAPGGPQPKVELSQEEYNFGTMQRWAAKRHTFVVRNTGDYPLEIQNGGTSCACAFSNLKKGEKVRIEPGRSFDLQVEWEAKQKEDYFRQTVNLLTSDPQRPLVQLVVYGRLVRSYEVHPSELAFSSVPLDEPKTIQAEVLSYLPDPLEIHDHRFSDPSNAEYFELEIEPATEARLSEAAATSGATLKLTVKPGMSIGPFSQQLTLVTNLESGPEVEISIHGLVSGPISVLGQGFLPNRNILVLGEFKSSEGVSKKLNVSVRGEGAEEIELKPLHVHPEILQVSFGEKKMVGSPEKPVVFVPMTVEIAPGAKAANYLSWIEEEMGSIVLETNHPEAKQFRMLVRFAIVP